MPDWKAMGKQMGSTVAEEGLAQAGLTNADPLTFEDTKAWIDGVLDGFEEQGRKAKGIRISHTMLPSMRDVQDGTSNDRYRGYPFVADESLWPNDEVQVVLL